MEEYGNLPAHTHSDEAFAVLESFKIGKITGAGHNILSEKNEKAKKSIEELSLIKEEGHFGEKKPSIQLPTFEMAIDIDFQDNQSP